MRRYPGNHTDSELLSVPRFLKTRPGAPQTHLAYITDSEANLLEKNKPGTPHGGPHGIPNYDSFAWDASGKVTESGSGGDWSPSGGGGWTSSGGGGQRDVSSPSQDTYKPPQEVYGKGAVPEGKRQTFTHETMGHQPWIRDLIKNIDPKTLAFWGVKQGAQTIPQELYQQLMQGSIVSGNEAVQTKHLYDTGQNWADYKPYGWKPGDDLVKGADVDINPITGEGISVGTFNSIQAGEHPMFPGGLKQYYSDMAPSFYTDKTIGGAGGGGGGGGGGAYATDDFTPRGQPNEAWGAQSPMLQAMINIHGGQGFQQGFARGGIVSLVA